MWQTITCPACGYRANDGDRYCGNCGVNLSRANKSFDSISSRIADEATQEIARRVNAYRKLYSTSASTNGTTVQNRNSTSPGNGTSAAPIRSEIIKLLSSLMNN